MYVVSIMKAHLIKSPNPVKKWRIVFEDGSHVDFGQRGYSDFTKHKNPARMRLYLQRHGRMGETWTRKGLETAGFWSRWLLWSKPTIQEAKSLIHKKFGVFFTK
jgi:hypothetical protein